MSTSASVTSPCTSSSTPASAMACAPCTCQFSMSCMVETNGSAGSASPAVAGDYGGWVGVHSSATKAGGPGPAPGHTPIGRHLGAAARSERSRRDRLGPGTRPRPPEHHPHRPHPAEPHLEGCQRLVQVGDPGVRVGSGACGAGATEQPFPEGRMARHDGPSAAPRNGLRRPSSASSLEAGGRGTH
jgi:hypothetical protein